MSARQCAARANLGSLDAMASTSAKLELMSARCKRFSTLLAKMPGFFICIAAVSIWAGVPVAMGGAGSWNVLLFGTERVRVVEDLRVYGTPPEAFW
ncbi:unannotated protein [freshwater metagenome]|uniref:Unannotated protein n=1 Tax=freshwater metagenome TaxID=449393 RepID=A0A6J7KRY4_9ZZZZ